MGRHIERRDDIHRQHPIQRLMHRQPFMSGDRLQGVDDQLAGTLYREGFGVVIVYAGKGREQGGHGVTKK